MRDPYDILGISPSANEEEVRVAYKRMAMKYYPDISDEKCADIIADKISEIDEAYNRIIKKIKSSALDLQCLKDKSAAVSQYADVRRLISNERTDDAEEILDGVGKPSRNSEWNYLKALILCKRGWIVEASAYAAKSYKQDPCNKEYSDLYNKLNGNKIDKSQLLSRSFECLRLYVTDLLRDLF